MRANNMRMSEIVSDVNWAYGKQVLLLLHITRTVN